MLDSEQIETYRKALLHRRETLQPSPETRDQAADAVQLDQSRVGRVSRVDALQQHAMDAAAQRLRAAELARIAEALQRMEKNTYGWCLDCGEPIAPARLDFDAAAQWCVHCAGKRER